MAISNPPPLEDSMKQEGVESIYISDNKLKYTNTKFKKVNVKIYDLKCDVQLKVGDKTFKAHRDVLSDASDYFSAMFTNDMKEKEQKVIELKEISPSGCSGIMDYFYHGHVTLDPNNVGDVLEAAKFLHVDWLMDVASEFLIRHLSLENYSAVIQLADKFSLGDLRWDIFKFLGQNLAHLTDQPRFYQNLSVDLLLQFLLENMYIEASEFFILQIILNWVKADPKNREEHKLPLLRQVRFPLMDIEELEVLPQEVLDIQEIRDEVEDAQVYLFSIPQQCLRQEEKYLPRGARAVNVITSFTETKNLVVYREQGRPGFFVEELGACGMNIEYEFTNQTTLGNFLYTAGGYDEKYCSTNRVFRYNPHPREWMEVASMNFQRVSFAMCSSKTNMFVCGGVDHIVAGDDGLQEKETVLDTVEMYSAEDNAWIILPSMLLPCFDQASAFVDNVLYITGGISSEPTEMIPLNMAACMPLGSEGFMPLPPMLTQRQGHSLTPLNGKLYAIGGSTSLPEVMEFQDCVVNEMFDLETKQWTMIQPTPESFGHVYRTVSIIDGKIYFIGGVVINAYLHAYNPGEDAMEEGEMIGPNFQKLCALQVSYPYT